MGVVYEGNDPYLQREVAIKVILSDGSDKGSLRAFFTETRAAGMLQHPHIVSVYDAGIEDDMSYIVMEYINGKTLQQHTKGDQLLPVEKVIDIIFKCCKGLDYAHRQGVIHCDIKPSNIMVDDDDVAKIMDFSIARLDSKHDQTQRVGIIGSPNYMSPEQVQELDVTPASDLYSLGAVMYELLTGFPPFTADNLHSLIYQIVHEPPVSLGEKRPDLPEAVVNVVDKALIKDPQKRYQSGQEFANSLSRLFDKLRYIDRQIQGIEQLDLLRTLDFFEEFSEEEIDEVMQAATWVRFETSHTILN